MKEEKPLGYWEKIIGYAGIITIGVGLFEGFSGIGDVVQSFFGAIILALILNSIFTSVSEKTPGSNNGDNSSNQDYHKNDNYSQEEIKNIYKKLVHKYHPDKSQNEDDKKFRNELMVKINNAYQNRDIETLKLFL